jgi:hypothetical protein
LLDQPSQSAADVSGAFFQGIKLLRIRERKNEHKKYDSHSSNSGFGSGAGAFFHSICAECFAKEQDTVEAAQAGPEKGKSVDER